MVVSMALIAVGVSLLAVGWATLYRARGSLVTGGLYGYVRHPQYLGLILIVVAFNLQWPMLLTLAMGPVLIVMYVRLARWENDRLAMLFRAAFMDYSARTPAFLPARLPVRRVCGARRSDGKPREDQPTTADETTSDGQRRVPGVAENAGERHHSR